MFQFIECNDKQIKFLNYLIQDAENENPDFLAFTQRLSESFKRQYEENGEFGKIIQQEEEQKIFENFRISFKDCAQQQYKIIEKLVSTSVFQYEKYDNKIQQFKFKVREQDEQIQELSKQNTELLLKNEQQSKGLSSEIQSMYEQLHEKDSQIAKLQKQLDEAINDFQEQKDKNDKLIHDKNFANGNFDVELMRNELLEKQNLQLDKEIKQKINQINKIQSEFQLFKQQKQDEEFKNNLTYKQELKQIQEYFNIIHLDDENENYKDNYNIKNQDIQDLLVSTKIKIKQYFENQDQSPFNNNKIRSPKKKSIAKKSLSGQNISIKPLGNSKKNMQKNSSQSSSLHQQQQVVQTSPSNNNTNSIVNTPSQTVPNNTGTNSLLNTNQLQYEMREKQKSGFFPQSGSNESESDD